MGTVFNRTFWFYLNTEGFSVHREEDVTVIMYTAVYNRTPDAPASTTISDKHASKVDTVCDAVRSALEQEGVHR